MLVTGGSGFLGQHLAIASEADEWELLAPPSAVLDIRRRERVIDEITSWKPTAVVHLAYRKDDRRSIVDGSRNVAEAAALCGARLVHLSTDVVFPGRSQPYTESDVPFPTTEYGRLKFEAEAAVIAACPTAVLVRTSLMYGTDQLATTQHDVERAVSGHSPMTFFTDEYRCPAHAADVAAAVSALADLPEINGPLHVAGPDAVSRAELAVAFARWMGLNPARLRTTTLEESGVIRPARVVLDSSLAASLGLRCRGLGDALS
jgi:dTDP-4-dehydrorhamnose reductase